MKHIFIPVAVLALVFALAGCGSKDTVVTGADGSKAVVSQSGNKTTIEGTAADGTKATVTNEGDKVSYSDDKGQKMEMGGTVSESDLGVPFYPGSEEVKSGSAITDTTEQKTVISARSTKDDPQKVGDFYKDKISNPSTSNMDSGGTKMVIMSGKLKGSDITISAAKTGSEDTRVSIAIVYKKTK